MTEIVSALVLLPENLNYKNILDTIRQFDLDDFVLYDPLFNDFYSYDWIICDEAIFNLSYTQLTDPDLPGEVIVITKDNSFTQVNEWCIKIGEQHEMLPSVLKWTYERLNLGKKYRNYQSRVDDYYFIGQRLTAEKDRTRLLDYIIDICMKSTNADAASLYIIVNENDVDRASFYNQTIDDKLLKFVVAKNNSVSINMTSSLMQLTNKSMAGFSAINKLILNIPDAYDLPSNAPFGFDKTFDVKNNYRTETVLVVPMKDHLNRVIGVIQLINKRDSNKGHRIIPFDKQDVEVIQTIAGQASIALDNSMMYSEMQELIQQYHSTIENEVLDKKRTDESNEMLLNAVEQSPNGTVILDEDGNIEYGNKSFFNLTGLKEGMALNETLKIIQIDPDGQLFEEMFRSLTLKNFYRIERELKTQNGQLIWVQLSIYPIELTGRQYKKYVMILENMTETKELNEVLRKKSLELELIKTQLKSIDETIKNSKERVSNQDTLLDLLNNHKKLEKHLEELKNGLDSPFKSEMLISAINRVIEESKEKLLTLYDSTKTE